MQSPEHYTIAQVADILGISKETLRRWDKNGTLVPQRQCDNNYRLYTKQQLEHFEEAQLLFNSNWQEEAAIRPNRPYQLVELFAGGGGLAVGMEMAGFESVLLNEAAAIFPQTILAKENLCIDVDGGTAHEK